jgi:hypothetical protein
MSFLRNFPQSLRQLLDVLPALQISVGEFRVIETIVKPSWVVPESIRRERPELP